METRNPNSSQNTPTEQLIAEPSPPPVAPTERKTVPRRRALLSDDNDAPPDTTPSTTPAPTSYILKTNRPTNQRRGDSLNKLLSLIFLSNLLLIGAFGAWCYYTINGQIEKRLAGIPTHPTNQPPTPPDTTANLILNEKLTHLQALLQAAQKRIEANELATKTLTQNYHQPPSNKPPAPTPPPPTTTTAPLADDLLILKERNRLTSYADEAIATAARTPYEQLWKSLTDPRLANLIHATRAEILRVQNYYLSGSRLDRFDIPIGNYYPDSVALRDTQLSDEQLIRLLSNPAHPWQVRLKAANLLGLRRSTAVGDALTRTIKTDPNLDVVKEATFSFEQLTGYRAQLFEIDTLESWWKQYTESPPSTPEPTQPKEKQNPKEKPTNKEPKPSSPTEPALPELKLPEESPTNN